MTTKEQKEEKVILLNSEFLDSFEICDDLSVITGGKGILQEIKDIIDDINFGNCGDCSSNGNCGC